MECTQRLDFEPSQSETESWRTCPEQVGFLGILGTKYPVKRGPNKIGRDPQTCDIVLNLSSISRQHAVINVLNGRDFMLMDLDSANKTRLNNKSLHAYLPVALSNGDTVQFGEAFGVFRLLEEDTHLPSTQAIDLPSTQILDVPDTPVPNKHEDRLRRAVVPESPDVSDKDDSFIVPSQPKPGNKFKGSCNNFIKPSSKTIAIQPVGSNKIDNIFWRSSKKSNSFNLDDSTSTLNESRNGDIQEMETQPPDESNDSIYTAETQLPPASSIHSQDTQLPALDIAANKENIYNAETQLSSEKDLSLVRSKEDDLLNAETQLPNQISPANKNDENIYEANTQLPFDAGGEEDNDNLFEAETQLPPNKFNSNKECKYIQEIDTQVPFTNDSTDSLYTAETQLPPVNASPSIYSHSTQVPKLNDFPVLDSPKSIHEVNTQLPFEEPYLSSKKDEDIFDAETQLPTIEQNSDSNKSTHSPDTHLDNEKVCALHKEDEDIFNAETPPLEDLLHTSEDKSKESLDKSDDIINFDEVEIQNVLDDFNASQPLIGEAVPLQEESEDIPLSQSDTITDDDFELRLEENQSDVKAAKRDDRTKSDNSTDCKDIEFLSTQKIPENPINEEELTDCEDVTDGEKSDNFETFSKANSSFEELATQVIPTVVPASEGRDEFKDLATQVIPEVTDYYNIEKLNNKSVQKTKDGTGFEDMLTQVIPEESCDNIDDLPTQVIPENIPSASNSKFLQCSEEVVASPFKIPLPTPLKAKRKEISKTSDHKNVKSPLVNTNTDNDDNEKYYAATQELFEDLCSQKDLTVDSRNLNNNLLKHKSTNSQENEEEKSVADEHKLGAKFQQLDGEIEISVKKFARETSSESTDGEEKVNKFVKSLSAKQINEVIGTDVAPLKRVPSDPSDGEVTPKKVQPFRFRETLLPDSQEIKTSVSLSTNTLETDSSSESEVEKESQDLTPIVHRKKKRIKADVKKDLTAKFDVQALPTRIITRTRKPTSKVQESDATTKRRGRNILKPKFLNDTEQEDEVDTEIISENITRLKNKNDKKNLKNTSVDNVSIEAVNPKSITLKLDEKNKDALKHDSVENSRNKSKNSSKNTVVDLTVLDKTRNKNEISKNNQEKTTSINKEEDGKQKTTKSISEIANEPRKIRPKKKDVQDKITNYTVNTEDSRLSNSVSKVEHNLNTNDSKNQTTKRSRRSNKDISPSEKSVPVEQETKRKRGRPRKEDKEKDKKNDNKAKAKEQQEKKEVSKDTKRRKTDDDQDIEPKATRRSKRQKTTKEQNDSQTTIRNHEQSTVYNVSSESSDSPKRKRVDDDSEAPKSKRTRSTGADVVISSDTSSVATTLNSNSSSLRSTPSCAVKTHHVLFTAFPCEEVKAKLQKLGAVIVSEVSACTVVLTLQLRRTFKLLCALGLGKPLVGPAWVQACLDAGAVVDPWQYLLKDSASETRFKFSLSRTLSGPRNYLSGYFVSATPKVLPSAPEMKLIVECSGGAWQPLDRPRGRDRWLVVSCVADRHLHPALRARGATVVTSELILSGVLKQELDIQSHLLQ